MSAQNGPILFWVCVFSSHSGPRQNDKILNLILGPKHSTPGQRCSTFHNFFCVIVSSFVYVSSFQILFFLNMKTAEKAKYSLVS